MCSTYLPSLNFSRRVSPDHARQDKIEIRLENGLMRGSANDVDEFFTHLGAQADSPNDSPIGRIFTRPRGGRPPYRKLIVRSRGNEINPAPLFSGSFQAKEKELREWRLFSELSLNPSRFLQHQEFPPRLRQLLGSNPDFRDSLFERVLPLEWEGEVAFLGNDNWIPDGRLWHHFASPRFWRRHLSWYLGHVVGAIDENVDAAHTESVSNSYRGRGNRYSLYSAETYWEFYSDDPISTVRTFRPLLETYCSSPVDERNYRVRLSEDVEDNSPRFLLETRRGEFLRIYAKTNHRIRFEVAHNLSDREHPFALGSGHTFTGQEGVLECLERLAGHAATRINDVLNHFRLNASAPDNQHTVLRFIADLQSVFSVHAKATTLLQILVNNGSIVVGNGTPIGKYFHDELKRLARIGVLMGSNRRYSVMPRYRQALQYLREDGMGVILGARRRRRSSNH